MTSKSTLTDPQDMFLDKADGATLPITPLTENDFTRWASKQPDALREWFANTGFTAKQGSSAFVPGENRKLERVILGVGKKLDLYDFAHLPTRLARKNDEKPVVLKIDALLKSDDANKAALGWALGGYQFTQYKTQGDIPVPARLVWPESADSDAVLRAAAGTWLARDLVNVPANDMGPAELAATVHSLAEEFGAEYTEIIGDALLDRNYPLIHAVGRASARKPLLAELVWGKPNAPKVTIIGKGIVFDTGGLDIKPSNAMLLMKKDMGGAAHALGLARMIMMAELPVRLRVLIPAAENAVGADSFRPMDIVTSRKGLTVEIGNTDAEGRLVLADALSDAADENPDMIVDFATLTGAARVALGPELPAMFSNDDKLADEINSAAEKLQDPLWRLPLWQNYKAELESPNADLNNVGAGPFGGAITAALFLEHFIAEDTPWVHIDTYAWNPKASAGRPKGGEAFGIRAVYDVIASRYG